MPISASHRRRDLTKSLSFSWRMTPGLPSFLAGDMSCSDILQVASPLPLVNMALRTNLRSRDLEGKVLGDSLSADPPD